MDLNLLHGNIIHWAKQRNLIKGSTVSAQLVKLVEEYGELASAVAREDERKTKDSIGDCLVVALILRAQLGHEDNVFDTLPEFVPFDRAEKELAKIKQTATLFPIEALGRVIYLHNRADVADQSQLIKNLDDFIFALADITFAIRSSFVECLGLAWNDIKDRKGVMFNGVFVKEADLMDKLKELDKAVEHALETGADQATVEAIKKEADELADLVAKLK